MVVGTPEVLQIRTGFHAGAHGERAPRGARPGASERHRHPGRVRPAAAADPPATEIRPPRRPRGVVIFLPLNILLRSAGKKHAVEVAQESLMANVDRVKRQLLRDLVQQNVDLAEGRLPRTLAPAAPLAARPRGSLAAGRPARGRPARLLAADLLAADPPRSRPPSRRAPPWRRAPGSAAPASGARRAMPLRPLRPSRSTPPSSRWPSARSSSTPGTAAAAPAPAPRRGCWRRS